MSEFIRKEVATLIRDLSDPRLGFITIISVEVSVDLRAAKIYYSVMGSDVDQRNTDRALKQASSYVRKKLGESLQIKSTPTVEFIFDVNKEKERPSVLDLIEKARSMDPE